MGVEVQRRAKALGEGDRTGAHTGAHAQSGAALRRRNEHDDIIDRDLDCAHRTTGAIDTAHDFLDVGKLRHRVATR